MLKTQTHFGKKINMPLFCSPTAVQRVFHFDGERAVAKAAEKFGTMFCGSTLGTVSVEEVSKIYSFTEPAIAQKAYPLVWNVGRHFKDEDGNVDLNNPTRFSII